ncbi:nuclear receptor subfamily 0, group B, member 2b [Osmerus eperlanus]|uniref:nuclear receptor subfamily 0, group B, member 2b n=1 Tax=Osmerus eperlanus TaxID=29151 RepID=UPI002E143CF3
MFPLDEMKTDCYCSGSQDQHPNTILYSILSRKDSSYLNNNNNLNNYAMPHNCHCEQRKAVCLKNPEGACQIASDVLVKTVRFMKSLPSFSQLPSEDQLALLRDCWAPLFLLGLAQERMVFEVAELPDSSKLRRILLSGQAQSREEDDERRCLPTLAWVHKLRCCLDKLWDLGLSPKEYAYLKGTLLFNPDVQGLGVSSLIESLQQEAQKALQEVILNDQRGKDRFRRILLAASTAQTVSQNLLTELFFRPVIGQEDLFELLNEMLFIRQEYS